MAKKILPIYLDKKDRAILEALAVRDGVSMGEAARRIIRNFKIAVVEDAPPSATEDAH